MLSRKRFLVGACVGVAALVAPGAHAACTLGPSSVPEPSLQQSFNALLGAGSINTATECLANGQDARWTTAGSSAGATIVLELAGNAGSNQFGIYDLNDPSRQVVIFQGNDGAGDFATLQITGTLGNYMLTVIEDSATRTLSLSDSAFGFYLLGANGPLFGRSSDNPGGLDYLYAYQGNGDTFVSGPPGVTNTVFAPNDYLLAWEDLRHGDNDYQDFVVLTRSVVPVTAVPLPSAVWLLISGVLGLVGVARTNKQS